MKIEAKIDVHESETNTRALTSGRVYDVIGIDDECFRIIDNDNEPVLYPSVLFTIVGKNIPKKWVRRDFDDGEYYIDPPEFSEVGFFEDYFDGVEEAVSTYNRYLDENGLRVTST